MHSTLLRMMARAQLPTSSQKQNGRSMSSHNQPYETSHSDSRLRFSYPVIFPVMGSSNRAEVRNSCFAPATSPVRTIAISAGNSTKVLTTLKVVHAAHGQFRETKPVSTGRDRLSQQDSYLATLSDRS